MSLSGLSDHAVAELMGERLAQLRLEQNLTQQQLADEIGLSRLSYRKLEAGEGKLVNFIAALRVLGRVDALEQVLPKETFSPMQQLQLHRKARKRASGSAALAKPAPAKDDALDW